MNRTGVGGFAADSGTRSHPEYLGVSEAATLIAAGKLSAAELIQACLERISQRESIVNAWAHIDPVAAMDLARTRDASKPLGPLHGVPVGIKDIIDTADMPTGYGTPIYEKFRPKRNAACVDRLLASGAIILGKTVTTELANRSPGKTANPLNPRYTPGGSSSGSAAAVADFMVPAALGTQTTGSLIRPASYCGVIGYKPTFGSIDTAGVMKLSPDLDTVGLISRSVDDLELVGSVLCGRERWRLDEFERTPPHLAICRTPAWSSVEEASESALDCVAEVLSRLKVPIERNWGRDVELAGLIEAQRTIMAFETAKSLGDEYRDHLEQLSVSLRTLIEFGMSLESSEYLNSRSRVKAARAKSDQIFGSFDALITPSTPGEAPLGLNSTGEPIFNAIWTVLHVPCVTVPVTTGPNGLPVGIQIVGKVGQDSTVLAAAKWILTRINGND